MPLAVQSGSTDLIAPAGATDPYTVHTHYFGFTIPEAELGCFVYLRWMPGLNLSQGGASIFRGLDNLTLLDVEHHDYRATMPWPSVDGGSIRVENGLEIDVLEPGKLIAVRYTSPDKAVSFAFEQRAVTPLLVRGHIVPGEEDHHTGAASGSEQFMHCTGTLDLRGETFEIDCMAVRDRSWNQIRREDPGGARRTPPLGWTPMYFGPDFAVNAVSIEPADTDPTWLGVYDVPEGAPTSFYSWLVADGEPRTLTTVRRTVFERHPILHVATRPELEVVDETGVAYRFSGEALAIAPMHSWPNVAFHDSVYRWTDERGRVAHCTYQEIWFDEYQRAMRSRRSST
ncbi:MAG: DUF7064 domain-containing protein [Sporichthyaceae bacterium]